MIPWEFFIFAALSNLVLSYLFSLFLISRTKPKYSKTGHVSRPKLGGIAVFSSLFLSFGVLFFLFHDLFQGNHHKLFGAVIASALIFLIGLIDDRRTLSYRSKLLFEILIVSILPAVGFKLEFITNVGGAPLYLTNWFGSVLIVGWIVFMMNAVNLIDGLDGLAAGIIAIAGYTIFLLAWDTNVFISAAAISLAFALLGILPFNFFPARFYLGDSGSLFIGFLIGVYSLFFHLKTYVAIVILIPLLILFVPILNTAMVIVTRLRKGRNPFKGDIFHLHYRLLRQGMSHKSTVVFLWVVTASLCALAVLRQHMVYRPRTIIFLFIVVTIYTVFVQIFLGVLKERRSEKVSKLRTARR